MQVIKIVLPLHTKRSVLTMKDSREHILETTYLLFMQNSFKAVTMKEIVEKTGLSKGAFYHYFTSKEQLFEEVVNHYFLALLNTNYDRFSQTSLKTFFQDELKHLEETVGSLNRGAKENEFLNLNFYSLIFDALRILPDFKKTFDELLKKEFKAWTRIIKIAKKNKEIKSDIPNEELARMFIYLNDGIGVHLIADNNLAKMKKELLSHWNNLYSLIKA